MNIKRTIAAAGLAVMLAFGAAAPVQADTEPQARGTSVAFNEIRDNIPQTIDLYNTSISGYKYQQSFASTRNNVATVCPKRPAGDTDKYYLMYTSPRGSFHELAGGQCTNVTLEGTYDFAIGLTDVSGG